MSCLSSNSYGITIRTRVGLNDFILFRVKAYLARFGMGAYAVIEGKNEKAHIHAQIFYEKDRKIDDVRKTFKRMIQACFEENQYEFPACLKIEACYDNNFLQYMKKDAEAEIILDTIKDDSITFDNWVYTYVKPEPKEIKKDTYKILREHCAGIKNIKELIDKAIDTCIEHEIHPPKDRLKNLLWWLWMENRKGDSYRGNALYNDLKDMLESPTEKRTPKKWSTLTAIEDDDEYE